MTIAALAGCTAPGTIESTPAATAAVTTATTAASVTSTETTTAATSATTTTEAEPAFRFQTKVCSHFYEDIFGKKMCDSWYSLVDAVLKGEDTFSCPDAHIYLWVLQEFPKACFPVFIEIIDQPEDYDLMSINGTARIEYKVSKKEAARKITEFEELVEGILNEVLKPEYTDLEKALALYSYFINTYTYDFETFNLIEENIPVTYTSAYRLLSEKTGICSEIAEAYSYLLMQVGIEASVVVGGKHEWSIIDLGGKYYHIDPTYALESGEFLGYFMMTDARRGEDGFKKKKFQYVAAYSPEVEPDYTANDKTFKPLWDYRLLSFDHATRTIKCVKYTFDEQEEYFTFDYSGCP